MAEGDTLLSLPKTESTTTRAYDPVEISGVSLEDQVAEHRRKSLLFFWWWEEAFDTGSRELAHILDELRPMVSKLQTGHQWQVFAFLDHFETAFRDCGNMRRQILACLDAKINRLFDDQDLLDHKKLKTPTREQVFDFGKQIEGLRRTSVVVVPDGNGFKVLEGTRFYFKAGDCAELRKVAPDIDFIEVGDAPQARPCIVVQRTESVQYFKNTFCEQGPVILEIEKQDTLGWLAQALKFPHQNEGLSTYAQQHRSLLAKFVINKVAGIQSQPGVKDTLLAWLTRGFKRSVWVENSFLFLEGEMFTELDMLVKHKDYLVWSVLGHVVAKLVEGADITGAMLHDPDASTKFKNLTWLTFPSVVRDLEDLLDVWQSKLLLVRRMRATAGTVSATGVISMSRIFAPAVLQGASLMAVHNLTAAEV